MSDGRPSRPLSDPHRRDPRRYRRRTVRVRVDYVSDTGAHRDTATTLGAGGVFVHTDRPLPRGTSLALRFRLPGGDRVHEIQGCVVWCRPASDAAAYAAGMGIRFTNPVAAAVLARDLRNLD
ncbi:MAG: TIGR02266 family protein [Acidobacteriota bacterium]|nr:TIGR02266 family protein [Acidobacteriota bacterium]